MLAEHLKDKDHLVDSDQHFLMLRVVCIPCFSLKYSYLLSCLKKPTVSPYMPSELRNWLSVVIAVALPPLFICLAEGWFLQSVNIYAAKRS